MVSFYRGSKVQGSQLWIGTVEVRPFGETEVLKNARGAFTNIVTWAANAEEYRRKAELVVDGLGGLFVLEVLNAEPVEARLARTGGEFGEDIQDLIDRALANPKAILYGTFETYEEDHNS